MARSLIIYLSALVFACSGIQDEEYKVYQFQVREADGLMVSDPVRINEQRVGKVKDLRIEYNSFIVAIHLDQAMKVPTGSSFVIEDSDLMGHKGVRIDLSGSDTYISAKDIQKGKIEELQPIGTSGINADSVINSIRNSPDYKVIEAIYGDILDSISIKK
jgi:hypothetical protein